MQFRHNHFRRSAQLSITAAICMLAQTAIAQPADPYPQPAPAPAPAPVGGPSTAPQNVPWDDVEHINGTPVKVGEKVEYLKANKRGMIGINPLGWVVGFYGVSGWLTLHNNVALKGDITYYNLIDDGGEGIEVSLGAPLYLKRIYQGVFIEPGFMHRSIDEFDETGIQVLAGWQRTWDSGFSVVAAMGPVRLFSNDDDEESVSFNGYFRVGYGF